MYMYITNMSNVGGRSCEWYMYSCIYYATSTKILILYYYSKLTVDSMYPLVGEE